MRVLGRALVFVLGVAVVSLVSILSLFPSVLGATLDAASPSLEDFGRQIGGGLVRALVALGPLGVVVCLVVGMLSLGVGLILLVERRRAPKVEPRGEG